MSSGRDGSGELSVFVSAVAGDADATISPVRAWAEAGADLVVLEPTADEPDPVGLVGFVAREIQGV